MSKYSFLQHPKSFFEQSHNAEKKLEGGPFGIFQHPFCRKTKKKLKGDHLKNFFLKKSLNAEKTERGTLWSRPVLYVTRETFLVQFPGPTGAIWRRLNVL